VNGLRLRSGEFVTGCAVVIADIEPAAPADSQVSE
jgi:hypothetical protein